MLEELILVLVVVIVLLIFALIAMGPALSPKNLKKKIDGAKERLKIAEKKYMTGEMKKGVFENLSAQIQEEIAASELALLRIEKKGEPLDETKFDSLVSAMKKPTPRRKAKILAILKETKVLRDEIALLEKKLLKREISQKVFDKLIMQKESLLVEKEKVFRDVLSDAGAIKGQ